MMMMMWLHSPVGQIKRIHSQPILSISLFCVRPHVWRHAMLWAYFFPSVIQFVFLSNGRLPRQWGFFIADCLIVKHPIVWRSQSHTCCWHPCRAPPIQSTRLPIPCLHRRLHTLPVKGRTVYANSHTKIKFVRDYYHSIPKESQ